MDIIELTPQQQQLRQAASIKEKLDTLHKELPRVFDGATTNGAIRKKRTMSGAVKRKIAAAPQARKASNRRLPPSPV